MRARLGVARGEAGQARHDTAGLELGEQHHGRDGNGGSDQHDDQVFRDALGQAARPFDVPREIQRVLDLLDHRNDGVQQEQEAHRAEQGGLRVLDELHDIGRELVATHAQRPQELEQHRLELAVIAERLQHRKRHGDDRHERKQRRIDETHRAQAEVAADEIAQQRVEEAQWHDDVMQRPAADFLGQVEQPVLEAMRQVVER